MTSRNTVRSASLMAVAGAMAEAPRAQAERAPKGGPTRAVAARTQLAKRSSKRGASPKETDLRRIAELKCKLRDEAYMNGAILRIATVLSARLTLR